jgi:hypothetical protein
MHSYLKTEPGLNENLLLSEEYYLENTVTT